MLSELDWLFVNVTVCVALVVPTATLPKFNTDGEIVMGVEFTVSVAGLLVTGPTELVTTTRNSQPLATAGTAGVVMLSEVAGVETQFDQLDPPLVLNCH
jgi:hypothetical protein